MNLKKKKKEKERKKKKTTEIFEWGTLLQKIDH
jgi:hypothetical protein